MKTSLLDIRLMDCMELMAEYPDNHFDLAIVDPPYGVGMDRCMKGSVGIDKRDGKQIQRRDYSGGWDGIRPSKLYFSELFRVSKVQLIWGGNFFADILPQSTHWIFWDKQNPMPSLGDGEICYTTIKRKSISRYILPYWGHQTAGENVRIHPTQKPVKLYSWLLQNYAKPGDRILDTHLGSGSIAIACHYRGHHLTACEIDPDYYAAVVERIQRETRQSSLFPTSAEDQTAYT
jgi:site-specific DNA-methyltransferase (adenine-specific)